jgi:hypothetical protein
MSSAGSPITTPNFNNNVHIGKIRLAFAFGKDKDRYNKCFVYY